MSFCTLNIVCAIFWQAWNIIVDYIWTKIVCSLWLNLLAELGSYGEIISTNSALLLEFLSTQLRVSLQLTGIPKEASTNRVGHL